VGDAGPETTPKSSGNAPISSTGDAKNGALDSGLALVIKAWPILNSNTRSLIVGVARGVMERKKNQSDR
jgi:hypothetical protein